MTSRERALDPGARHAHALDLAFRHLARRDRTVIEMRRYLEGKRIEPAQIESVLAELQESGYLDDARYAQRFAEDRRVIDGWGPDRIEHRLLALGVEPELITAALAVRGPQDELAAALALLERRFAAPLQEPRDRSRALGMLVRRGYDVELAHDALRAFSRGDVAA